jgi:hypothetical protein
MFREKSYSHIAVFKHINHFAPALKDVFTFAFLRKEQYAYFMFSSTAFQ